MRYIEKARAWLSTADKYEGAERYRDAARSYEKARLLLGRVRPDDERDHVKLRLRAFCGQARIALTLGELALADRLYGRALKIAEQRMGARDLATAEVLNELGVLRKQQGRYEEASHGYRRALRIVGRKLGLRSDEAATLYHNLGGSDHARGRLGAAEAWTRKALALKRPHSRAPERALEKSALAAIVYDRGRRGAARRLYREALAVLEREAGPTSSEVGFILANLAATLDTDDPEAEALYRRAIPLLRRRLGVRAPQLALTFNNYAALLHRQGRSGDAMNWSDRACAIVRDALGPSHPHRMVCDHNHAVLRAARRARPMVRR
jgi:tetratricopeptide (TPR) repeat protein